MRFGFIRVSQASLLSMPKLIASCSEPNKKWWICSSLGSAGIQTCLSLLVHFSLSRLYFACFTTIFETGTF